MNLMLAAPPSFHRPSIISRPCDCCNRPLYKPGNEAFGKWTAAIVCVAMLGVAWICLRENKR